MSFNEPVIVVAREEHDQAARSSPSVVHQAGMLLITWTDRVGGHVAAWPVG